MDTQRQDELAYEEIGDLYSHLQAQDIELAKLREELSKALNTRDEYHREARKLREENRELRYQIECKNGLLNNHQCIPRMAIKQAKIEVLR